MPHSVTRTTFRVGWVFALLATISSDSSFASADTAGLSTLLETYGKSNVIEVIQRERHGQITVVSGQQFKQMWGRPQATLVTPETLANDLDLLGYNIATIEHLLQDRITEQSETEANSASGTDYLEALRERQQRNALLYGGWADTLDEGHRDRAESEARREYTAAVLEAERDQRALERIQSEKDFRKMRIAASGGKITLGMPSDLVRQAWGLPTTIDHHVQNGERVTVWHYRKIDTETVASRSRIRFSWDPRFDREPRTRARLQGLAYVYFNNAGKVIDYSVTSKP